MSPVAGEAAGQLAAFGAGIMLDDVELLGCALGVVPVGCIGNVLGAPGVLGCALGVPVFMPGGLVVAVVDELGLAALGLDVLVVELVLLAGFTVVPGVSSPELLQATKVVQIRA